jgi:arylsulfatase A-like enzyme
MITTDHWPAALFGVAGHPSVQTPTLDQLARNGTRFTNAYSECPVCIPARRTLMTGTPPRTHGDRVFKVMERMPQLPTLAQTFRDAGYQATAVGKLHVYPQRDRIGFDDVLLAEEGRPVLGAIDDYDLWLTEQGYPGEGYGHGMSNNDYAYRPWHLPEPLHVTNWATRQMCRTIHRRDPTRPAFWYLSYCHPHPPLVPLPAYLDLYRDFEPPLPVVGRWATEQLPYALRAVQQSWGPFSEAQLRGIRRAFYALCTHIDHQLRLVIGTLREAQLLDNTIILFTADHGDMLGDHHLWAKRLYYEGSANVPMLLMGTANDPRVGYHRTDNRLVGWQDVMPTLLDLAGIPIPDGVEGLSMVGAAQRSTLYGECGEDQMATRMIHNGRYKLIYYPVGNHLQLFDLERDPQELEDLAGSPRVATVQAELVAKLMAEFYGGDEVWVQGGELVGLPDREYTPKPDRGLSGQRGTHWPPPPFDSSGKPVGAPG